MSEYAKNWLRLFKWEWGKRFRLSNEKQPTNGSDRNQQKADGEKANLQKSKP